MKTFAAALEFDGRGTVRLMKLLCGSYMIENNIRPHLTLGVFMTDGEAEERELKLRFDLMARDMTAAEVSFSGIGMFGTSTVFAEPELNEELKNRFYQIYAVFVRKFAAGYEGLYLPGRWIPHVSVGTRLSEKEGPECYRWAAGEFDRFCCLADKFVLAECDPYRVVRRYHLPESQKPEEQVIGRIRLGMTVEKCREILGSSMKRDRVAYDKVACYSVGREASLIFGRGSRRLHVIRLSGGMQGGVYGIKPTSTRMDILRMKGEPSRFSGDGIGFYSSMWFYPDELPGVVIVCEFDKDPMGRCRAVYICDRRLYQ